MGMYIHAREYCLIPNFVISSFRYTCLDPTRKVVSLKKDEDLQYDVLDVKCLFNGKWDRDIEMYACSGGCS